MKEYIMKTCFSEGKLMKKFGNFSFPTDPPFFHYLPLYPKFKNKNSLLNFRGRKKP